MIIKRVSPGNTVKKYISRNWGLTVSNATDRATKRILVLSIVTSMLTLKISVS